LSFEAKDSAVSPVVYLNGDYTRQSQARISVDDRGFLLADGVYEVTSAYDGRLFRMEQHVARMRHGLATLRIDFDAAALGEIKAGLLEKNGLADEPVSYVYVQVTRGVAPRTHAFPDPSVPASVYGFARPYRRPPKQRWLEGFKAVTVPDQRWARVDVKAIALLPNVLAQQAAADAGASDAIFVRDGMAMEGAHNNLFAVFDGVLATAPKSNYILHGVTRDFVIGLARDLGIATEERAIPVADLFEADEVFLTGTTTEIRPIAKIDDRSVGGGAAGPTASRLFHEFLNRVAAADNRTATTN